MGCIIASTVIHAIVLVCGLLMTSFLILLFSMSDSGDDLSIVEQKTIK